MSQIEFNGVPCIPDKRIKADPSKNDTEPYPGAYGVRKHVDQNVPDPFFTGSVCDIPYGNGEQNDACGIAQYLKCQGT